MSAWSRTQILGKVAVSPAPLSHRLRKFTWIPLFSPAVLNVLGEKIIVFVALGYCQQGFTPLMPPPLSEGKQVPLQLVSSASSTSAFLQAEAPVLYLFSGFPGKNNGQLLFKLLGAPPAATYLEARKSRLCDLPGSSFEWLKLSFSHK